MVIIFVLPMIILGFFLALLRTDARGSKRAFSVCSRLVLAFLKSAPVLFGEFIAAVVSITCIFLATGNHYIIDYYIIVLFSALILIKYHTLKLFGYTSVKYSL